MSWFSSGPNVTLKETIIDEMYRNTLGDQVRPMMHTMFPAEDGIFQNDNASILAAGGRFDPIMGVSAKMLQTSRRGRGQQDDSKYIGNAGSEMLS
ncbi:hypothetical protein TNCV_1204211 [Trichonephila clavipes]|nr:hypothetical protein TNCV_1204211 [Trichonephila clavipes]